MPFYLLRFTVETCLVRATDWSVTVDDIEVKFLFSKKDPSDPYVRVQTEIEAANNREAQTRVSTSIIPPILDALAFATGTPLLLVECELILKAEGGSERRRAIYVGHRKVPTGVALTDGAISDAVRALGNDATRLSRCWHRYALHRQLTLDQFVFRWLAFEALAGDADISSRCPRCGVPLEHCGTPVTHRGSSRDSAMEIFLSANPAASAADFKVRLWNKARNSVFHGLRYPEPPYLAELAQLSTALRKATERRISELAGMPPERPASLYEDRFRVFFFVEWVTSDTSARFAPDWPEAELVRRTGQAELNQVFVEAAPRNLTFLRYEVESGIW